MKKIFLLFSFLLFLSGCANRYEVVLIHTDEKLFEAFRVDTYTGKTWQFTPDRKWEPVEVLESPQPAK